MIKVQNGSVISKNNTPTLWLRLLRKNRAITFGRYPSFFAVSSMRLFVAGAIYRASGALFNTIETVAGENPLCVATSRIVTVWFFSLDRFTVALRLSQISQCVVAARFGASPCLRPLDKILR